MHCVIRVYNTSQKKKWMTLNREAIMLSHARYFETLVKKKKDTFQLFTEIVS